jgi:acetolactate synthase small subunit
VIPARHAVTRVLSCCTARGIEIVDLTWHADGHEARATLALRADPARLARVRLCLERLVDVLEVEERNDPLSRAVSEGGVMRYVVV